ncbi:hypothetical protein L1787_08635 [Acuticoccus sp. M5D2P5]|uniref:hypothetical protein n=1 Tax=Acuticoccus kalidii TaxID=2910977 RepID=UPI001F480AC5|nr:hypothetical protein [Acuticoccus kalidii]MCF3933475.1 hypothetical protein [Acuticoccus kalidii]
MTDFYSVLQRAVASLPDGSGPQRRAVYDKARKALLKQLQSFDPPLPSADVTAQRLALEDAIRKIENEIARQIRTRRAVQGAALPARAGQGAPSAEADRESEAEREARRRAEQQRNREQQAALLQNAVSEATLVGDDTPANLPVPQPQITPAPIEEEPAPDEVMFEADLDDTPETVLDVPRSRRSEPAFDQEPLELEYESERAEQPEEQDHYEEDEVYEDEVEADEPVVDHRAERRRRREEERALRAEQRAERSGRRKQDKKKARRDVAVAREDGGKRRRSLVSRMVLPVIVLALLVGASYAAFTQREKLMAVIDSFDGSGSAGAPTRAPIASSGPSVTKNSDRLPSTLEGEDTRSVTTTTWPPREETSADEGEETNLGETTGTTDTAEPTDEASSGPARTVGSDVSPFATDADTQTPAEEQVAAVDATQEAADEAEAEADDEAVMSEAPIGDISPAGSQQAVLYEEAAQAGEQGSAVPGGVEWSMVRQSVGGGEPEPVVRANAEVPDRDMSATITIRENRDGQLPASHLIEISFNVPSDFEGGGVKNVPGLIMKETEQSRGDALRGAAARVSSGLFWIALSEESADREANLRLLRDRDWIDIPILYESGRRAILTLRKGNDGFKSVNAAIQAWSPG